MHIHIIVSLQGVLYGPWGMQSKLQQATIPLTSENQPTRLREDGI